MSVLSVAGRPISVAGRSPRVREWGDLTDWTHTWDWAHAVTAGSRVYEIPDPAGGRPLRLMPGSFPLLGGDLASVGPLPGPLYIPGSARFNGRPAARFDRFTIPGSLFNTFAGLSPNTDFLGTTGVEDEDNYFAPPFGYPQPYWVAVLGRIGEADASGGSDTDPAGLWDATHGGIGTGPTIGRKIIGLGDEDWQVSNFGPGLQLLTVDGHAATRNETVFVVCCVDGASSFLEVNYRTAAGTLTTLRATGLQLAWNYLECFAGWVHGPYLSAVAIARGRPPEAHVDRARAWASYWIPPAGAIAEEP